MKYQQSVFLILFGLLWHLFPSQPLSAQSSTPTPTSESATACLGVDMVFLVDQSGSISGYGGATATDPLQQREYAVETAIDLLTDIALDLCPDVTHRVAVISYGTNAHLDLPLTLISPDTLSEALELRETLKEAIIAQDLGQTDPQRAFLLAAQELNRAAPLGEQPRKRAIIFITDGQPCIGSGCVESEFDYMGYTEEMKEQIDEDFPFDPTLLQQEQCLQDLREEVGADEELPAEERNFCLEEYQVDAQAYQNSTYIWTILLRNNLAYARDLQALLTQISTEHAGTLFRLDNNRQQVPTIFRQIIEQLTGVRAARLSCAPFAVNPYLQKATFNFYKFDPSLQVTLSYKDVNGHIYTLTGGETTGGFEVISHYVQGANERYELAYPYPGIWQLQAEDCDGLDAYYDPIKFGFGLYTQELPANIPQRDLPPYYDQDENARYYLEYQMRDTSGKVIPQADDPLFAVNLEMVVTTNEGQQKQYPMVWLPSEALFRATEPLQTPVVGTYTLRAVGTTVEHEGEPTSIAGLPTEDFDTPRVLFEQTSELIISSVIPFDIKILTPTSGETLKPIHGQAQESVPPPILPIIVEAQIITRQEEPITNLGEIFPNPAQALMATLSNDANEAASITLNPDPSRPGVYIGQIEAISASGQQEITVELNTPFSQEYYPDRRFTSVTFTRIDETWHFDILSPTQDEVIRPAHQTIQDGWPLRINPIPIRARLVDSAGQPYSPDDPMLQYAPTELFAELVAGEQMTNTILTQDPDIPGEYRGQISNFGAVGEHQLTVQVSLQYPSGYSPESEPKMQKFSRLNGILNLAITYQTILALIILYILFRIWRFFAIRSNPITGTLSFGNSSSTIAEFNLSSGKNWKDIPRKNLTIYPELELKQLRAESLPKQKRSKKAKVDDPLSAMDNPMGFTGDRNGIKISYTTVNGIRQSMMLNPDQPAPYSDSFVQMTYKPL